MRKKFIFKLVFLTPIIALVLSCPLFFYTNYPSSLKLISKWSEDVINLFSSEAEDRPVKLISLVDDLDKKISSYTLSQKSAMNMLNSTVRVSVEDGSMGSGVVIYTDKIDDKYYSYVITNVHVIKKFPKVKLERFIYYKNQSISSVKSYMGKVILRDDTFDLALIQLETANEVGPSSHFDAMGFESNLYLYQPVFVAGCSLGKPPFITNGNVCFVSIERNVITAFSIFGNSGGGAFNAKGELLGLVRGISIINLPDGKQVPEPNLTHMIPGPLIRSWLIVNDFSFIIGNGLISHKDFLEKQKAADLEKFKAKKNKPVTKSKNKSKAKKK